MELVRNDGRCCCCFRDVRLAIGDVCLLVQTAALLAVKAACLRTPLQLWACVCCMALIRREQSVRVAGARFEDGAKIGWKAVPIAIPRKIRAFWCQIVNY